MKKNFIAILSAAVVTVGAVGGVAFANNMNDNTANERPVITLAENVVETNQVDSENDVRTNANNPSNDVYQDMVEIMKENGYKDAASYMQTGDFDAMTDYMNSLTDEDFDQMVEIMNNNQYGFMGEMMESIGREGMIEMHNSMGSARNAMMGRFSN